MALTVALRLEPAEEEPTLENLTAALDRPARPLFLGRKACPPASPLNGGLVEAQDLMAALARATVFDPAPRPIIVLPDNPEIDPQWERVVVSDRRDWISGVHAGARVFRRGRLKEPS
jgi:CRISPR system Cascade subunit CasD